MIGSAFAQRGTSGAGESLELCGVEQVGVHHEALATRGALQDARFSLTVLRCFEGFTEVADRELHHANRGGRSPFGSQGFDQRVDA